MTAEEKNRKVEEIERLGKSLECWLRTPMLDSVKEIGAEAIRCRLSEVSRPLRDGEKRQQTAE